MGPRRLKGHKDWARPSVNPASSLSGQGLAASSFTCLPSCSYDVNAVLPVAPHKPPLSLYKYGTPALESRFSFFIKLSHSTRLLQLNPTKTNQHTHTSIKMETIKNAANYVAESVQGTGAEASKEANKVCSPRLHLGLPISRQLFEYKLTHRSLSPRTATLPSERAPRPPRTPSATRSIRPRTTPRPMSTRRFVLPHPHTPSHLPLSPPYPLPLHRTPY